MKYTILLVIAVAPAIAGCSERINRVGSALQIGSDVSCASCVIDIESLVTLQRVGLGGRSTGIVRDSARGMYYLLDEADNQIKAFDGHGRLARRIGRPGPGPGQYEMVRNLLISNDGSITVIDPTLQMRSTFSSDGQLVSRSFMPVPGEINYPAVLRADGQLLVNTPSFFASGAMTTIQVFDRMGLVSRSLDTVPATQAKRWLRDRLVWQRSNGQLLVARPFALTIDIYNSSLRRIERITRTADFFPAEEPDTAPGDGVFDRPHTPRLTAMWEDGKGVLWLVIRIPSPAWTPRPRRSNISHAEFLRLADRPRFVTVIEAIDVGRRSVLSRARYEGNVGIVFEDGLVAQRAVDSVGGPRVRISRITLKDGRRHGSNQKIGLRGRGR